MHCGVNFFNGIHNVLCSRYISVHIKNDTIRKQNRAFLSALWKSNLQVKQLLQQTTMHPNALWRWIALYFFFKSCSKDLYFLKIAAIIYILLSIQPRICISLKIAARIYSIENCSKNPYSIEPNWLGRPLKGRWLARRKKVTNGSAFRFHYWRQFQGILFLLTLKMDPIDLPSWNLC